MIATITQRLSQTEREEWTLQKSIISKGREGFWATVSSLEIIRRKRLFREEFESFEQFALDKLDMSSRYANKLIEALSVRSSLGAVVPEKLAAKVDNPWKLRNLKGLKTERMVEVVEHANAAAGGGTITGRQLCESRREVLGLVETDETDTEASDSLETFRQALSEVDSVDALLIVLESIGSTEDQSLILAEVAPELCEAIRQA